MAKAKGMRRLEATSATLYTRGAAPRLNFSKASLANTAPEFPQPVEGGINWLGEIL